MPAAEWRLVAASSLLLSSEYKASVFFQKLTPHPHISFHLKSFLWKGHLAVKKITDQILNYSSFCFEIVRI